MYEWMNKCSCTRKVKWGLVKLPRWLKSWVRGALTGYVRVGSGSDVCDGTGITWMGHPTSPYLSLGSGPSHSTDLATYRPLLDGDSTGGSLQTLPGKKILKLVVQGQKL